MKVLALDFGSSFLKAGIFEKGALSWKRKGLELAEIHEIIYSENPDRIIASSVKVSTEDLYQEFGQYPQFLVFGADTPIPVRSKYTTAKTLGTDRMAAVIGAWSLYPDKDILVIDCGTCITYDLLTAPGIYEGGGISPGIELRFKALNTYTSRLPLLERVDEVSLVGDSTKNAILSGVINGTTAEIREIIRMYRNKLPLLHLVICGGDAEYFARKLDLDIEVRTDLVLTGLKTIQEHNG